ncbi:hypothetical protein DQW51_30430, partial [Escherichia coli O111:H-]
RHLHHQLAPATATTTTATATDVELLTTASAASSASSSSWVMQQSPSPQVVQAIDQLAATSPEAAKGPSSAISQLFAGVRLADDRK